MRKAKDILILIFALIVISAIAYGTFLFFYVQKKYAEIPEKKTEIIEIIKSEVEKVTESKEENVVSKKRTNCELETLVSINSLLEKGTELNDQNFAVFFANMNPECSNNVEYNGFNNELIYRTLESNPKKFIAFLSRVSKKKEIMEFVLTQLRNPIHDGIELKAIYRQLHKTETEDTETKELVSESIKKAIEKNN